MLPLISMYTCSPLHFVYLMETNKLELEPVLYIFNIFLKHGKDHSSIPCSLKLVQFVLELFCFSVYCLARIALS